MKMIQKIVFGLMVFAGSGVLFGATTEERAYQAVLNSKVDDLKEACKARDFNVNYTYSHGMTLVMCIAAGHTDKDEDEMLEILINGGADLTLKDSNGNDALMIAIIKNTAKAIEFFVNSGMRLSPADDMVLRSALNNPDPLKTVKNYIQYGLTSYENCIKQVGFVGTGVTSVRT